MPNFTEVTAEKEAERQSELVSLSAKVGVHLSPNQAERLYSFYQMVSRKNADMNLTAITGWDGFLKKHFLDSLCGAPLLTDTGEDFRVIDIGAGAGFPGIPLKIAFPNIKITLLDSLGKRVDFLNEVILALDLKGAEAVRARAEDLGHEAGRRESYDLAVSRAVAKLPELLEYCMPFVKRGGIFAAFKGADADREISASLNAFAELGCSVRQILKPVIPESDFTRTIICVKRDAPLHERYPRRTGVPAKRPL